MHVGSSIGPGRGIGFTFGTHPAKPQPIPLFTEMAGLSAFLCHITQPIEETLLTFPEKIILALAVLITLYAAWRVAARIIHVISRGQGKVDWSAVPQRLANVVGKTIVFQPVFRFRFWPSLFHGFVGWAFIFYLLVNLGDTLEGFLPDFEFLGTGPIGNTYRLIADILSVAGLAGMVALIIRRFIIKPATLTARQDVLLSEKARAGIRRDSAIVGAFILVHVGSRFLGQSF